MLKCLTGNIFCSHPTVFPTKEKYNTQGQQIGVPSDSGNDTFSICIKCHGEFKNPVC